MYEKVGKAPVELIEKLKELTTGVEWKLISGSGRLYFTNFPELQLIKDTQLSRLGNITNAFFLRIPSGGMVHSHTDNHGNSYHVPVNTNSKCVNYMYEPDETAYYLKVGVVYKVDRSILHRSINKGKTDRVHLIFEID